MSKRSVVEQSRDQISKSAAGNIQLAGISFPYSIRELGASVELLKFEDAKEFELDDWAEQNKFTNWKADMEEDTQSWGIISGVKSGKQQENLYLLLSLSKSMTLSLQLRNGLLESVQKETIEPLVSEFHANRREGLIELYSCGARQRTSLIHSLKEQFGEDSLSELYLTKDAMKSLMAEAIEVSSISLTALGNPFFSDASFSGTDPANSKTCKELMSSGEIKSFRAKYQPSSSREDASTPPLTVNVTATRCRLRFYGRQAPISQSDIEDFVERVANIASTRVQGKTAQAV